MLNLKHKKLKVWNKSILLVKEIYKLTKKLPDTEKFGLTSQMRRAAVSISSNISEGASRSSQTERNRFYEIARSSLVELDTQIEISIELEYLIKEDLANLDELLNANFALITNMIKSSILIIQQIISFHICRLTFHFR